MVNVVLKSLLVGVFICLVGNVYADGVLSEHFPLNTQSKIVPENADPLNRDDSVIPSQDMQYQKDVPVRQRESNNGQELVTLNEATQKFYESGIEKERLEKGMGHLEKVRTDKILEQLLPPPPATILDVGGGLGVYTFDLAKRGYSVYLIDPVAYHIEEAKKIGQTVTGNAPSGYIVGDARKIEMNDKSADVVLLSGPLYHLDPAERKIALSEAYRVLKSGGILFSVAITRYAPIPSFFKMGKMTPELELAIFESISKGHFEFRGATFYSHYPDELRKEMEQAGFKDVSLQSIEGLGSFVTNEVLNNEEFFQNCLRIINATKQDESVLGISTHIMAIGKK